MKKLNLNKKTIAQLEREEMSVVKGGGLHICLISCRNGTRKSKKCCGNRCSRPLLF